ncbi:MAG: LuxR family transcriptional regulator [Proteobacteria bacterium]|nr:LuxR family transcriptional regulator [Pseudomonadota bacterium]HQR04646.1 LuxR C-terminal-related transcriptional regulator [Rhodocyclaceae bacterium]
MNDALANLIALIYEGPTDTRPWQGFATALRTRLAARNVVITLHHAENETGDLYVMAGPENDPVDWDEVEARYRQEYMATDPLRLDRMAPGELGLVAPDTNDSLFGKYLAGMGLSGGLRCCFAEPGGIRCWIDVVKDENKRSFTTADQNLLRTLTPHLNRALGLYARLKRQESEKAIYETMVDHFALGCILLNEEGKVIHFNRVAAALIAQWQGISIFRNRITLSDRQAQRTLDTALQAIAAHRCGSGKPADGELIRLRNAQGRLLGLLVYPAPPQPYYRGGEAPGTIVYLSDLGASLEALRPARSQALTRIGKLFDLTRQESTLALLLAYGHTIAEAAGEMSIAETAARNYSKKIYAKMGVASQTDLVRLMLRSVTFLL